MSDELKELFEVKFTPKEFCFEEDGKTVCDTGLVIDLKEKGQTTCRLEFRPTEDDGFDMKLFGNKDCERLLDRVAKMYLNGGL